MVSKTSENIRKLREWNPFHEYQHLCIELWKKIYLIKYKNNITNIGKRCGQRILNSKLDKGNEAKS